MYRSSCYIICICVDDKYLYIGAKRPIFNVLIIHFSILREYVEILCAFIFLRLLSETKEISSMQNLNLSAILNLFLKVGGLGDVPCDKDKRYVNIYPHFAFV